MTEQKKYLSVNEVLAMLGDNVGVPHEPDPNFALLSQEPVAEGEAEDEQDVSGK